MTARYNVMNVDRFMELVEALTDKEYRTLWSLLVGWMARLQNTQDNALINNLRGVYHLMPVWEQSTVLYRMLLRMHQIHRAQFNQLTAYARVQDPL